MAIIKVKELADIVDHLTARVGAFGELSIAGLSLFVTLEGTSPNQTVALKGQLDNQDEVIIFSILA